MNIYLKWSAGVALTFLLMLVLVSLIGKFLFIGPVYNTKLLRFDDSITTVIIGASHSATGIAPTAFENSINVAKSAEPVYFTYYKTKNILENNPSINTLVIAMSPLHIGQYSNNYFFAGNSASREAAMKYYMFIDEPFDPLLPIFNSDRIIASLKYTYGVPFSFIDDIKIALKYYLKRIEPSDYKYFGGYEAHDGSYLNQQEISNKAKYYFYDSNGSAEVSNVGQESLRRIVGLTNQYDIKLIILNTPMHELFRKEIPSSINESYYALMEEFKKNPKIIFKDYSDHILPDSYFLDGDHLNNDGARAFEAVIVNDVKNKINQY